MRAILSGAFLVLTAGLVQAAPKQDSPLAIVRAGTGHAVFSGDALDLTIDGRRYLDPEGLLANVTISGDGSEATFLVGRGTLRTVKYLSAHSPDQPITVGELEYAGNAFTFRGSSGVVIAGSRFVTLPSGIALWRDDAMFIHNFGENIRSVSLPTGMIPADRQRGDIAKTNIMLVRVDDRGASANERGLEALGSLGAMFGLRKAKSDFALFDLSNGHSFPLPIENINQDAALFENGSINGSHYFARVDWVASKGRRFAAYFSGGVRNVNVIDLDSGVSKLAMTRGLGIQPFAMAVGDDGTIALTAGWMFKNHRIDDVAQWFDGAALPIR